MFSERVKNIDISGIRKMFEGAGPNSINLGLGQPDFDTPQHIKDAAIKAINDGLTGYTMNLGFPELRIALCRKFEQENHFKVSQEEVIVTSGASEALHLALCALVNKEDEVLIPDPGFVSYIALTKIAGATPVSVPLGDKLTMYPSWENTTVVTKINETKRWIYTTPPEDKRKNFTWIWIDSDSQTKAVYWPNDCSIISMNDTTIVISQTPAPGETMFVYNLSDGSKIEYIAVNFTADKIYLASRIPNTGNFSYSEINRTITIIRNETEDITYTYPIQEIEQMLSSMKKNYDPNLSFSVNEKAGKYLIYDVQIVKIYKTG